MEDGQLHPVQNAFIMGGKLFNLNVTGDALMKPPHAYRIVGTSVPRVDIPQKFTGQQSIIQELQVPGMLHARLVRPPSSSAKFVSLDESSISDLPGVVKLVQRGNFIGIVTQQEEQAVLAAQQLKVQWSETPSKPPMPGLYTYLRSQHTQDHILIDDWTGV